MSHPFANLSLSTTQNQSLQKQSCKCEMRRLTIWLFLPSHSHYPFPFLPPAMDIILVTFKLIWGKRCVRWRRGQRTNLFLDKGREGRVTEKTKKHSLICNAGPAVPRCYQSIRISSRKKNWISHHLVS